MPNETPFLSTEFWYRIDDTVERAALALYAPQKKAKGDYAVVFEYTFGEEHTRREAFGASEWQAFTIALHIGAPVQPCGLPRGIDAGNHMWSMNRYYELNRFITLSASPATLRWSINASSQLAWPWAAGSCSSIASPPSSWHWAR